MKTFMFQKEKKSKTYLWALKIKTHKEYQLDTTHIQKPQNNYHTYIQYEVISSMEL